MEEQIELEKYRHRQDLLSNVFLAASGIVKFARIVGEYRFCSLYDSHRGLLKKGETVETVESAGFVVYESGTFFVPTNGSMLLQVGPEETDGPAIAEILGFEYRPKKDSIRIE